MEQIEIRGDPMLGPHAGLVMLRAQTLWKLVSKLRAGRYGDLPAVAWLELQTVLTETANYMVERGYWADAAVYCNAQHNPQNLVNREQESAAIGFKVMVKSATPGATHWGGDFTVGREFGSRGVLVITHRSHGDPAPPVEFGMIGGETDGKVVKIEPGDDYLTNPLNRTVRGIRN